MNMDRKFNLILISCLLKFCVVGSFQPLTKEEQLKKMAELNDHVEPFRKNITECGRQVKASMTDVDNFLNRIPQSSMTGKCLVACILKRNELIKNNKIYKERLMETNKAIYGDDSEVVDRMEKAIDDCSAIVEGIFEICEYASMFNDCMHMNMEHMLDKVLMERRMEAMGMFSGNEQWDENEDDLMKLMKDEL